MAEYHKCVLESCNAQIVAGHLMCPPHWRLVPMYLRQIIWTKYRSHQLDEVYYRSVEQAKQIVTTTPKNQRKALSWQDVLKPGCFRTRPKRSA